MSEALARPAIMTHVAIRTSSLEASVAFYQRYAGLHVVHQREDQGIRVVWLSHARVDPEFVIVVLELPHSDLREPSAADHLGFDVPSRAEVDRIAELARESGCLKYGPADAGPIVGYFCMLRDPSGNTCEFSYGQPINPRQIGTAQ
jgi:catechol 2,3-dioxygenase-like lactoylglutathione lyase family enzyme